MEIVSFRQKYPLYICLKSLKVTRNQYYYWLKKINQPDKDRFFIDKIKELSEKYPFYGQNRLYQQMRREGYIINHKKLSRIYRELALVLPVKKEEAKKDRPCHIYKGVNRSKEYKPCMGRRYITREIIRQQKILCFYCC